MDVVPANPEEWERDPFALTRDGDKARRPAAPRAAPRLICGPAGVRARCHRLPGSRCGALPLLQGACHSQAGAQAQHRRGLHRQRGERRHFGPAAASSVLVSCAGAPNAPLQGVGIDEMEKRGELKFLKNGLCACGHGSTLADAHLGPLFWVDSANFGPTLGTGGMATWQCTVNGKKFHSGLPHKAVNSIELAMEVVRLPHRQPHESCRHTAAHTRASDSVHRDALLQRLRGARGEGEEVSLPGA